MSIREIAERDAKGRTAEIYADIRATQGLPLVNLIWRHLATDIALLEWAWDAARPLYASGVAAASAAQLIDRVSLPHVQALPPEVTEVAGIDREHRATIQRVLDAYNRGNGLNLIALSALIVEPCPDHSSGPDSTVAADGTPELPPIPDLARLAPATRALVLRLNALGPPSPDPAQTVVASLYRHLALWPGYLPLAWLQLAPLQANGSLAAAIAQVRAASREPASRAAEGRGPTPAGSAAEAARSVMRHFVDTAICRMIPIGVMLRRSLE